MIKNKLINILKDIDIDTWNKIVKQEPEWIYFEPLNNIYSKGQFSLIMLMSTLNAYQLKGKAQEKYFPILSKIIQEKKPTDYESLKNLFSDFYKKERTYQGKIKRVNKVFDSDLAKNLWSLKELNYIKENFKSIWQNIAKTLGSKPNQKTIAFAMKCLGVFLMMNGINDFDFEGIPIPIDSRVKKFVKRLGLDMEDKQIIVFFDDILKSLKHINMIHLDSLIWQIGNLKKEEIVLYFENIGEEDLASRLNFILDV